MEKITIVENDLYSLYFHDEEKIVHHVMHKLIVGDPFKTLLTKGLHLLREKKAVKWLSDDKNNPRFSGVDYEWATKEWFPKVLAEGWKYWAVVLPEEIHAQMFLKHYSKLYSDFGLEVKLFTNHEDAFEWLKSK